MDAYFFSFLLHLTCQKRPSTLRTHPVTRFSNKKQNKKLAPILGKQKWNICSSQPTPRAARSLAPEPSKCLLNQKRKTHLMCHILHYQIQSTPNANLLRANGHTIIQYFAQDLVIYEPSSLQHSTRNCDLIFGDDASHLVASM